MSLSMRARLAGRDLDVALDIAGGQTLALLGANGSGKSTVLALLAGLLWPDEGEARLDGRTLFAIGPAGAKGLPPHERNVGLLAQEPLLFPRMTVLDNVAFGARCRGRSRKESRADAASWLARVDAAELADRKPAQLSGGQAQRVALARSLATEPALLLLDEPLSAIDVAVAVAMRQTLRRVLTGRTAIIVTHEVLDAVLLCDQVAVLDAGRVVEQGPIAQVLRQPRSAFAASISGLNMVRGSAVDGYSLRADDGTVLLGEPDAALTAGVAAVAIFRPAAVSVHVQRPSGSPRNLFEGRISGLEPQAHLIRVRMGDLSADITPDSMAELQLAVGARVVFAVKAAEVSLYHA